MRIVFFTTVLGYSGAPKMMAWVANRMAKQGHSVKIFSLYSDKCMQPLDDGVEFASLDIKRSKSRFVRSTFGMLKGLRTVHKAIKKESPDVVVTFLDTVGYMYLLKNRFSRRYKIIASERGDPYTHVGLIGKIKHKILSFADKIVFQTEGARDCFANNKKIIEKSVVIPNPIIPKNSINSIPKVSYKERDNRIVSVGRLDMKQKRYDVMIEAFETLHKKHPELELHIYGDGQDKDKIQAIIDSRELSEVVFLRGRTDNVEQEIFNARAFVITSDYEGIPNSLIEAMLAGVPSVATDCSPGGAKLLIENNENGMVVPRGDSLAFADALLKVIEDEKLSNKFSLDSPKIMEKFSEQQIAELWKTVV